MVSSMMTELRHPRAAVLSGLTVTDLPNVATLPRESMKVQENASIRQSAIDFETAFINQMLKFSGLGNALVKGGGEDVSAFTDFYIQSFAEKISNNGGLGLADKFYSKLKLAADPTLSLLAQDRTADLNSPITIVKEKF